MPTYEIRHGTLFPQPFEGEARPTRTEWNEDHQYLVDGVAVSFEDFIIAIAGGASSSGSDQGTMALISQVFG